MSVWRRLQRVGKKAAKFQFTVSLHELCIECSPQYKPGDLVIVWSRHSRRHTSQSFQCTQSTENTNAYSYVWTMPENVDFTTTLYRSAKDIQFEEKEWVCQLEEVGNNSAVRFTGPSVRRRVLSARQVEMSLYAASIPTQSSLKIAMRLASKKLRSATLLLTLHSVILKEGEATDEDMISIASLMSLSRQGSFNLGSRLSVNDGGSIGSVSPALLRFASFRQPNTLDLGPTGGTVAGSSFHQNLTELTAKLKALEQQEDGTGSLANGHSSGDPEAAAAADSSSNAELATPDAVLEGDTGRFRRSSNPAHHSTISLPAMADPTGTERKSELGTKAASTRSAHDLLLWCQQVTRAYPTVRITDLTSSFQSGVAFCAILHHFHPDQIDFNKVLTSTPLENCRLAFDVASKLGIPRVLDPTEITSTNQPPDLLCMMTYLHQIRTCCCSPSASSTAATGVARANASTGGLPPPSERVTDRGTVSRTEFPLAKRNSASSAELSRSPTTTPTRYGSAKRLSCSGASDDIKSSATDFRSSNSPKSTIKDSPSIQFDHMLSKARMLLQQTRSTSQPDASLPPLAVTSATRSRPPSSASAAATGSPSPTSTGEWKPSVGRPSCTGRDSGRLDLVTRSSKRRKHCPGLLRFNFDGTISQPNGLSQTAAAAGSGTGTAGLVNGGGGSPTDNSSGGPDRTSPLNEGVKVKHLKLSQLNLFASGKGPNAPTPVRIGHHRFSSAERQAQSNNISPQNGTPYRYAMSSPKTSQTCSGLGDAATNQVANNLQAELEELEQAERELDAEAAGLEQQLRAQMKQAPGTMAEEKLLQRWFVLVNRKNALIHRGYQLSIMEKEDELKQKTEALQSELRALMTMESFLKTDNDRLREEALLRQLVKLIEERDEMVKELDRHEHVLAETIKSESRLRTTRFASRDRLDNCVLQ